MNAAIAWQSLASRTKLYVHLEKETIERVGSALGIAGVVAVAEMHPALDPLLAIPVLVAARLGERDRLGFVAGLTALFATVHHRYPNLEAEIWGGFVSALSLGLLALTADRMFGAPRRKPQPATDGNVAIVVDCDGLSEIDARYGDEAKDHVTKILARTLESETTSQDLVARTGDDEFVVVLQRGGQEGADEMLSRVRHRFAQAVADAGYECSVSIGHAPFEPEADPDLGLIDFTQPTVRVNDPSPFGAYLN